MIKKVHSSTMDGAEAGVVVGALVACILHAAGIVVLDPVDYGVAIGAVLTPVAMFAVRLVSQLAGRIEGSVGGDE